MIKIKLGYGWYVEEKPLIDKEFSNTAIQLLRDKLNDIFKLIGKNSQGLRAGRSYRYN